MSRACLAIGTFGEIGFLATLPGLEAIADVGGIVVSGVSVETVRSGLEPTFERMRRMIADGVHHLGASTGAIIAAEESLGSGSRIGDMIDTPR